MDPFCEALERLLVKDGQPTPRTLMRIMENLPYSRLTILKHLKEMEIWPDLKIHNSKEFQGKAEGSLPTHCFAC